MFLSGKGVEGKVFLSGKGVEGKVPLTLAIISHFWPVIATDPGL